MKPLSKSPRRLHSRQALAWTAAVFACAQLLFIATVWSATPEVRDPEFGHRIKKLRKLIAERDGKSPEIIVVGSSRVAMGIRPDAWLSGESDQNETPLLFNFGHCYSGPLLEALTVDRLVREGITPKWFIVEVWPPLLGAESVNNCREAALSLSRLDWQDVQFVRRFDSCPSKLTAAWAKCGLRAWWVHKRGLLEQFASPFVAGPQVRDDHRHPLSPEGWLDHPAYDATLSREHYDWNLQHTHKHLGVTLVDVSLNEISKKAYAEIFATCKKHDIRVAMMIMPESAEFRDWYDKPKLKQLNQDVKQMCADAGVQLFDLREWLDWTNFYDGFHLTHAGAARFTEQLGDRVLEPLLRSPESVSDARKFTSGRQNFGSNSSRIRPAARALDSASKQEKDSSAPLALDAKAGVDGRR